MFLKSIIWFVTTHGYVISRMDAIAKFVFVSLDVIKKKSSRFHSAKLNLTRLSDFVHAESTDKFGLTLDSAICQSVSLNVGLS